MLRSMLMMFSLVILSEGAPVAADKKAEKKPANKPPKDVKATPDPKEAHNCCWRMAPIDADNGGYPVQLGAYDPLAWTNFIMMAATSDGNRPRYRSEDGTRDLLFCNNNWQIRNTTDTCGPAGTAIAHAVVAAFCPEDIGPIWKYFVDWHGINDWVEAKSRYFLVCAYDG